MAAPPEPVSPWQQMESPLLRLMLRVLLTVGLVFASPFLLLALVLYALDAADVWVTIFLSIGLVLLLLSLVGWLVVRAKVRAVRERVESAHEMMREAASAAQRTRRPDEEDVIDGEVVRVQDADEQPDRDAAAGDARDDDALGRH